MNILKNFFKGKQIEKKTCSSCGTLDPFQGLTDIQRMIAVDQNAGGFIASTMPFAKVLAVNLCQKRNAEKLSEIINYCYLRSRKGEKKRIESADPVFDVLFGMPNDLERNPQSFFKFLLYQYYQSGVAYAHAIGNPPKMILSLESLFSENVTPVENLYNPMEPRITGYKIFDARKEDNIIPPEQMLVIRDVNPYHRVESMSPYIPLLNEMSSASSIDQWQRRSFENGVKPDVIITLDPDFGVPTDEQWEQIFKGLGKRYKGPGGETVLVSAGGGNAIAVKTSPADLELIKSKRATVAMIAAAYGMPFELLSLDTVNYATAWIPAERSWIKNTIVPLAKHFVREINSFFYVKSDREIVLGVDQIPELMPTMEDLEKITFLTINQKLEILGKPRSNEPFADKLLIHSSLQLLEDLEREQEPETENI